MIYPLTKDCVFGSSVLASVLIHLAVFICMSVSMSYQNRFSTRELIPISLLEPPQKKTAPRVRDEDTPVAKKKLTLAPQQQAHKTATPEQGRAIHGRTSGSVETRGAHQSADGID
jgi:hypothetical protein